MKNREKLREMLVEIYDCVSAWDNDDGKMAEANEKTPEEILSRYLEEERDEVIKQFSTGEFIRSEIAEKFYQEAYNAGYERGIIEGLTQRNPNIANSLKVARDEAYLKGKEEADEKNAVAEVNAYNKGYERAKKELS